jgi:hypothetical protein
MLDLWPRDLLPRLTLLIPETVRASRASTTRCARRKAHGNGVVDWHNVVLYIVRNRAFVHDLSALLVGAISESGKEVVWQVEQDDLPAKGIDAKMLANVNTAARLWGSAYGPKGCTGASDQDSHPR